MTEPEPYTPSIEGILDCWACAHALDDDRVNSNLRAAADRALALHDAEVEARVAQRFVDCVATDEHVGMNRDQAIGYEEARTLVVECAARIASGGEQ